MNRLMWSMAPLVGAFVAAGCSVTDAPQPANGTASVEAGPSVNSVSGAAVTPSEARSVALNVQGSAPVGLTVRVKAIELGTDATALDVSASYGGTTTNDVSLAGSATYLLDEQGNRLMLKPPQDNPSLRVIKGQTMDGKLIFLGAVPANARSIKLVFNDNNDGNSIVDPGLTIPLPLGTPPR